MHKLQGDDRTRDNVPSPGTIISVPSRLEVELESNVILEFPSAAKLVSEVSVLLLFETSISSKVG